MADTARADLDERLTQAIASNRAVREDLARAVDDARAVGGYTPAAR